MTYALPCMLGFPVISPPLAGKMAGSVDDSLYNADPVDCDAIAMESGKELTIHVALKRLWVDMGDFPSGPAELVLLRARW
jgi:hypothetical protein